YLPNARFQSEGATGAAVDDTLYWTSRFDADGVRIDAVPMMPRGATRRIARALRDSEAPSSTLPASPPRPSPGAPRALFTLGEVFTGAGQGGLDQIKYYLGRDGLDSTFDFPLMWALRSALASAGDGFEGVESI